MRCAAVLVLALLAACGAADHSGPVSQSAAGRYTLRTIDGDRPPAVITASATRQLEILAGVVTLQADGTYADSTEVRITDHTGARQVTDVSEGTYTHVADRVNFSSVRGEEYHMTITETSLYQDLVGSRLIYRK